MSIDITNHLIPYTTVKQMLTNAWDEGRAAEQNYTTAFDNWREHITEHIPKPPTNPYQDNKCSPRNSYDKKSPSHTRPDSMQASNGPKKEATLSALQDRSDMIEHQRERLHNGIERIYAVAHAWCSCDYTQTVEDEFEACLKVVDLAVIRVGAFYVVELSKLADRVCAEADRIEREGVGE